MADDRDRTNDEYLGRPADEELIGTADELDDDEFNEADEESDEPEEEK